MVTTGMAARSKSEKIATPAVGLPWAATVDAEALEEGMVPAVASAAVEGDLEPVGVLVADMVAEAALAPVVAMPVEAAAAVIVVEEQLKSRWLPTRSPTSRLPEASAARLSTSETWVALLHGKYKHADSDTASLVY
jgi:hypothetical protein